MTRRRNSYLGKSARADATGQTTFPSYIDFFAAIACAYISAIQRVRIIWQLVLAVGGRVCTCMQSMQNEIVAKPTCSSTGIPNNLVFMAIIWQVEANSLD